jgi:hypothetical protein
VNIHAPLANASKPIQLFKVGDFVRIQNGETVGRVLEDTDANGTTAVKVFDDDSWGDSPKFARGILSMWTPSPAARVAPEVVVRSVIDTGSAIELVMRIMAMGELSENHGLLAANEDDGRLASHMQVIGSVVGDMSGDLLDMLYAEQSRQEAESKSDEN